MPPKGKRYKPPLAPLNVRILRSQDEFINDMVAAERVKDRTALIRQLLQAEIDRLRSLNQLPPQAVSRSGEG